MRIFILHNRVKAGSYAEAVFFSLVQLLSERNFTISEVDDVNQVNNLILNTENRALILHTQKNRLSFFSVLKLKRALKKNGFDNLIQITDTKPVSSKLPQLVISNNDDSLAIKNSSPSIIFAVCSKAARQKVSEQNEIIGDRLKVIPVIADDNFQPINWSEQQSVKMQYTHGREYFLVLAKGKTLPAFTELLKAFSIFKKWQHSSMKLVVIGGLSFTETEEWKEKISTYKFREDVVLLDTLNGSEIINITAGAYVFIHTPNSDNDILPVLQAMKCETSCMSFSTDSIKEYACEAVVMIEQNKYDLLAEKMILLYKDEALRSQLINKGKEVTKDYTKERIFAALSNTLSLPLH